MTDHEFTVTVSGCTAKQAMQVMTERISVDEDYGFEYSIDFTSAAPEPIFGWHGWEAEPEMTGDGSGDPDTYFITITEHGEEYAVIVHRTCGGKYPLDGVLATQKQMRADDIVAALNATTNKENA